MKKNLLLLSMTLFLQAEISTEIGLTIGYNKFDDPEILKKSKNFHGFKVGIYQDESYGIEVGYEKANDVNCQKLNFKRTYLNAVAISKQPHKFNPYALLTVGYEQSNIHRFKPSQTFVGAGVGIKKSLLKNFNAFSEAKIIKKLKSNDTDIITTLGVGYALK